MPRVDFSGVREFTPIPEGTYEATLSGSKVVAEAKTSKQPFVELTFTVAEGEHAGRKMFRNFSLQPQALWAFKQAVVRLGADPDSFSGELEFEDLEMLLGDLVGSPCRIAVGTREFQGQTRNEVQAVLAPEY